MASVSFKFGNQEAYDALVEKDAGALYIIEDKGRIYRGETLVADVSEKNVVFTNTVPAVADAETDTLYVVNDGNTVTIYVKTSDDATELTTAAGGTVAEGAITDLNAFDPAIVDTAEEGLSEDDAHVPTSGAVAAAIAAAVSELGDPLVDVSSARAEDNSGSILTFTTAEGETKQVTIADMFLTSVSYDPATHILSFTVRGIDDAIEVDLSDIVPQAVDTTQVALAEGFVSTVDVGSIKKGDTISVDSVADVQALIEKIFCQDVDVEVTQPSAIIVLTDAGAKEVGTAFAVSYNTTFNPGTYSDNKDGAQATGVTASTYAITDTNSNTSNTAAGTFDSFTVADDTNYSVSAVIEYTDGAVPTSYLGTEQADKQIKAGSVSVKSSAVTGYRQGFFGTLTSKDDVIDTILVRGLATKSNKKVAKGQTYTLTIPAGAMRVVIAYDASIGAIASVTSKEEFNSEISATFDLFTVAVADASGSNAINYNVYVKNLAEAQQTATTYTIVI